MFPEVQRSGEKETGLADRIKEPLVAQSLGPVSTTGQRWPEPIQLIVNRGPPKGQDKGQRDPNP